MNRRGKTLTIFVVILFILSFCLIGILLFFYYKEIELRKTAESKLIQSENLTSQLQTDLKESQKRNFLLEEKNKEADEKINSLLDDLELEQGLREEIKSENLALNESIQKDKQLTEEFQKKVVSLEERQAQMESQLSEEKALNQKLAGRNQELENQEKFLQDKLEQLEVGLKADSLPPSGYGSPQGTVELEKIVISPNDVPQGRIISVDQEVEFIIFNLGLKDQVVEGDVFAVYRGNEYLGDVKVTRVQEEMSAADFIPPFSSRKARKNDMVVLKR